MYTLIRLLDGRTIEAVVLANTRSWMRLVTPSHKDAVELQLRGSDWVNERDEPVQFEFLAVDGEFSAVPCQPRVAHAGAGFGSDLAYG
jgi:hypothetical protein